MAEAVDIFFSYPGGSPADSDLVSSLGRSLERFGLTSWIADRDRPPRDDLPEGNPMLAALESASALIACFGRRPGGHWRSEELVRAYERARQEPDFVLIGVVLPGGVLENLDPDIKRRMLVFDFSDGSIEAAQLVPFLWSGLRPRQAELLEEVVEACLEGPIVLVGPPGSGKSALAEVAATQLEPNFPDGLARLAGLSGRGVQSTARLIMRTLGVDIEGHSEEEIGPAYESALRRGRYLVVLDEVDLDQVSRLIPPPPSSAIFISLRMPAGDVTSRVFSMAADSLGDPESRRSEAQPGYASDAPEGRDLLAVQVSVNALSSVIAAKEVHPPLSIGLFGDWGAGKSFFLQKMRERIDALADASAEVQGESAYVSAVRQVVFNAWHYADANLWASLANRVFEGLIEGDGDAMGDLFARLESSRLQLDDATSQEKAAAERHQQAEDDARAARRELSDAKIELMDVTGSAREILIEDGRSEEAELLTFPGSIHKLWEKSKGLVISVAAVLATFLVAELIFPGLYAWFAAAAATVLGVVGFVGGPLRILVRARVSAERRAEDLRRRREAELAARVEVSRWDEHDAIQRRERAQRDLEEAQLEIAEISDGRRLYRFIEERAGGDAYDSYLGLMSLVRKDFERLGELIERHDKIGDDGRPRLERIVLYVDDLDRCPASRVVEVLEAVHLLLASELFVVVVAVDPRWLVSSLLRHYGNEMRPNGGDHGSATPQDYLEKIFQIPFSLPPMSGEGYRRLLASLISVEDPDRPDGIQRLASPGSSANFVTPLSGGEDGSASGTVLSSEPSEDARGNARIELNPIGLRITPREFDFLSRLDPMVTTPRAAKRLANLYRLLRVSLSERQLNRLLGSADDPPDFPRVQLLLAITVGFPSLAPWLFVEVEDRCRDSDDRGGREGEDWWAFVDSCRPPVSQVGSWQLLLSGLATVRYFHFADDLIGFASWVPYVSRFSYGMRSLDG